MVIVDSGLGGISVVRALLGTPHAEPLIYVADTGGFPYGKRSVFDITNRAIGLMEHILARHPGQTIVLACNTLSTLCLTTLRERFSVPFVGTVPAIKTAAKQSVTRRFTLLATPNTAQSHYSQGLINEFANDCVVDVYGAPNLAVYAETLLLGGVVEDGALRNELAPAFCNDAFGKTDSIVLGCTHYPLIQDALERVSPWPVQWVDSSEAIARRARELAGKPAESARAYVTSAAAVNRYRDVFAREGFPVTECLPL